jgi:hypothetical protein
MMMTEMRVRKAQVRPIVEATFPTYRGRTFRVEFVETVTFRNTNWSGGTRSFYQAVRMTDGESVELARGFTPWANPVEGRSVDLPEDIVVVEHVIFCGKDLGLRFLAHPSRSRLLEVDGG